jgi:hypothetical protein
MPNSADVVDAALLRAEMRARHHDVVIVRRPADDPELALAVAQIALAGLRGHAGPSPRDEADGERVLEVLWSLGCDVRSVGKAAPRRT